MLHRYGLGLVPPHRFANALAIAGSVSWLTPASGAVLHSGFPQAVGGLASGVSTVRLYWAGSMTLAATANVVAGAWSTTVTPTAAQVGETSLLAVAGGATAVLTIVVKATPRDLDAVLWGISNNGELADSGFLVPFGSVTLDEASVDPDPGAWGNNSYVTVTGSGPYAVRATVDDQRHFLLELSPTAAVTSYCDINFVCDPAGSQQWVRASNTADWANFDLVNGVQGNHTGSIGATTITKNGSTCSIHFESRGVTNCRPRIELLASDEALTTPPTYVGDTGDGIDIASVSISQPRVSVMTDESLTALNEKRNAHLTQGTDANQPLFYTGFASVNGLPVAYGEGRVSYLRTTHADVIGAVSGNPPTYALFGVASMAGPGCRLIHATGIADYEIPIYDSAGTLYSYRTNGTVSNKSFGVATSLLATAKTYAVVSNSDRTVDLYIDGSYIASVTHNAIGAVAITIFDTFHPASTGDSNELAEMALLSGQIPGAAAAARYAWLKPTLQAMGARWGGLAA